MSQSKSKANRSLSVFLIIAMIALVAGALYFSQHRRAQQQAAAKIKKITIDGTVLQTARNIKPFLLTDNQGHPFSNDNLKNHWTLMFFGFTNCGFVCPTTMAALNKMYVALQKQIPAKQLPRVVMVSVDPTRDSVARMNSYVKSFNPNFIGARADMVHTKALESQMNVVAVKVQSKTAKRGQYTISHSADVMLLDPQGKLRAFFAYPHTGIQMAKDYVTILKAFGAQA